MIFHLEYLRKYFFDFTLWVSLVSTLVSCFASVIVSWTAESACSNGCRYAKWQQINSEPVEEKINKKQCRKQRMLDVGWCPHPHLQRGCWGRLWRTTKIRLRSGAWQWARLVVALTLATIIWHSLTQHVGSYAWATFCPFWGHVCRKEFSMGIPAKCSQVSEYYTLSSMALGACHGAQINCTNKLVKKKDTNLQASLPCLPSKKGCTETCVSYTIFSLSLLLTSVDVELLPPKTSALQLQMQSASLRFSQSDHQIV